MVPSYRYVDSSSGLDNVISALEAESRFALDTEFHRERTYWPEVSLVQIAWPGDLALIDARAVDMRCLAPLFDSEKLVVLHAASQDLDALEHACGTVPRCIFDTQIAAGFVRCGVPSLASLYESELGLKHSKEHQLTDWLSRPLSETQLQYAANDVAHLLEVHDLLSARLTDSGRIDWAEAEFRLLIEAHERKVRAPEEAWRKVKGFKRLKGSSVAVARSLAIWRQERASNMDRPLRHVMSDVVLIAIAMAIPNTKTELAQVRGVTKNMIKKDRSDSILSAIAVGVKSKWQAPPQQFQLSLSHKRLRSVVDLIAIWVRQVARDKQIEPSLLATRADIVSLICGESGARLAQGWRTEIVGETIQQLIDGKVSLAFSKDAVVLERRSFCAV